MRIVLLLPCAARSNIPHRQRFLGSSLHTGRTSRWTAQEQRRTSPHFTLTLASPSDPDTASFPGSQRTLLLLSDCQPQRSAINSVVQWNALSDIAGCMKLRCIQNQFHCPRQLPSGHGASDGHVAWTWYCNPGNGTVRITSCPNFNGSHFGLPPSEIHRITGLLCKKLTFTDHSHRTRGRGNSLRPFRPSSRPGTLSFSNRAPLLWNNLPPSIQQAPSTPSFKSNYLKYLLCSPNSAQHLDLALGNPLC